MEPASKSVLYRFDMDEHGMSVTNGVNGKPLMRISRSGSSSRPFFGRAALAGKLWMSSSIHIYI